MSKWVISTSFQNVTHQWLKRFSTCCFPFRTFLRKVLSEKGSGIALKNLLEMIDLGAFFELVDRLIERKIWWHLIVEPQQLDHVGSLKNRINNMFFPLGVFWLHPKHSLSMRLGPPQKKEANVRPKKGDFSKMGDFWMCFLGCFYHFPRLPPAHVSPTLLQNVPQKHLPLNGNCTWTALSKKVCSFVLRQCWECTFKLHVPRVTYNKKVSNHNKHWHMYLLCSFLVLDLIFTCKLRCFIQYGLCQASLWIASLALPRTSDLSGWLLAGRFSRSWLLFPKKNA